MFINKLPPNVNIQLPNAVIWIRANKGRNNEIVPRFGKTWKRDFARKNYEKEQQKRWSQIIELMKRKGKEGKQQTRF